MPDRPPPIRVPCEGTGQPADRLWFDRIGTCPACGAVVFTETIDARAVTTAHDRNDVAAMVARGDFDG